jgi:predicted HTH domain antitoxin
MQIAVDLPNDFVMFQGEQTVQRDIRLTYALWLFKAELVTIAKAAQIAGLDIFDFMAACKDNRIPVIAIDRAELLADLNSSTQ